MGVKCTAETANTLHVVTIRDFEAGFCLLLMLSVQYNVFLCSVNDCISYMR